MKANRVLNGEPQAGFAALGIRAILQGEFAAMTFGDLAAEDEPDAGAAGLGGEEGDEEIGGVGNTRSVVEDPDVQLRALAGPADLHASAGF